MLAQLRKQAWFVFLMVFAMGWSSIAFASVKPLHQQMMSQSAGVQHQQAQMMAMTNCHESQTVQPHMQSDSAAHVQHHSTVDKIALDSNCHQHNSDQQRHLSCHDCAQLHCQSLTTWLDVQSLGFADLNAVQESLQPNFAYTAQHLTGFWQKILRPPKA